MIRKLFCVLALCFALSAGPALGSACQPNLTYPQADLQTIFDAWTLLTRPANAGFGQRVAAEFLLSQLYETPEGSRFAHPLASIELTDTYLEGARLSNGYFHSSIFHHVSLAKAQLCDANLQLVRFENTVLVDANLSKAILHQANFDGSNVYSAIFDGADLAGADFRNSKQLTQAQVDSACYKADYEPPQLPGNLTPPPVCP